MTHAKYDHSDSAAQRSRMAEGCPWTENCPEDKPINLPVAATRNMDKLELPLLVTTIQLKVFVKFALLAVIPPENTEAPPEPVPSELKAPVAGLY